MPRLEFVFDLDDTLYKEHDYVRSCFAWLGREVCGRFSVENPETRLNSLLADRVGDPIGAVWRELRLPDDRRAGLVEEMRAHAPSIALGPDAAALIGALRSAGRRFSIVTDGRSVTQRAKIAALGLDDAESVWISEETGAPKPDPSSFSAIAARRPGARFVYVADNPAKDFIAPNRLGWHTVMVLDDGRNVPRPPVPDIADAAPAETVRSLDELLRYVNCPDG